MFAQFQDLRSTKKLEETFSIDVGTEEILLFYIIQLLKYLVVFAYAPNIAVLCHFFSEKYSRA